DQGGEQERKARADSSGARKQADAGADQSQEKCAVGAAHEGSVGGLRKLAFTKASQCLCCRSSRRAAREMAVATGERAGQRPEDGTHRGEGKRPNEGPGRRAQVGIHGKRYVLRVPIPLAPYRSLRGRNDQGPQLVPVVKAVSQDHWNRRKERGREFHG